ncbi:MAG: LiaF transmembrane domain-containing protein [Spirosomataceae bacterium]
MEKRTSYQSLFWALLLITVGGAFLLVNFNLLDKSIPLKFLSWRLIPLFIGLNALLQKKYTQGAILVGIATFFYLPEFIDPVIWKQIYKLWPLGMIIGGIAIAYQFFQPKSPSKLMSVQNSELNLLQESIIMGGSNKKLTSPDFKGGSISCIWGGAEIDLKEAKLGSGAALDVFIIMGGAQITVPKDWTVIVDAFPFMGGVEDKITKYPEGTTDPSKVIRITGTIVMGGLEIKRY